MPYLVYLGLLDITLKISLWVVKFMWAQAVTHASQVNKLTDSWRLFVFLEVLSVKKVTEEMVH